MLHDSFLEFPSMLTLTRILAIGLTLAIAACATTPPPAVDLTPPPRKATDAKTQLESGRRY
jgi:hypothetical protein